MVVSSLPPVVIADDHLREFLPVRQHMEKAGVKNPLTHLSHGNELMDFLRALGPPAAKRNPAFPALLFIQLHLPPHGAFEPLHWIRQHPSTKELPVIIIAESFDAKEVKRAAALGVARFVGSHAPPRVFADIIIDFCRYGTLP